MEARRETELSLAWDVWQSTELSHSSVASRALPRLSGMPRGNLWINQWSLHVCSFHKPHMDQPLESLHVCSYTKTNTRVIAFVFFSQTTHGSTTVIACVFFPQTTYGSTSGHCMCVLSQTTHGSTRVIVLPILFSIHS